MNWEEKFCLCRILKTNSPKQKLKQILLITINGTELLKMYSRIFGILFGLTLRIYLNLQLGCIFELPFLHISDRWTGSQMLTVGEKKD